MRQQHQPRHRLVVIELGQERGEEFWRLRRPVGARMIGPVAPVLARAEEEHLDAGLPALLREAEDIGLVNRLRIDALALGDETHGLDAIPVARRRLEIELLGGLLHLLGKLGLHHLALAIEESFRLLHQFAIGRGLDIADTRRRAALDLVQQAGPRPVRIDAVIAGAQQEGLLQRVDRPVDRARRSEGSIIAALAVAAAAMLGQLRDRVVLGDEDIGKRLVVAQHHVEAGLQLLDEVGFQQQGFGLGAGGHELHVHGQQDHRRDAVGVARGARVVRDPVLQVPGLADIDDIALRIIHAIDAGLAGQPRHEIPDDVRPGGSFSGFGHGPASCTATAHDLGMTA